MLRCASHRRPGSREPPRSVVRLPNARGVIARRIEPLPSAPSCAPPPARFNVDARALRVSPLLHVEARERRVPQTGVWSRSSSADIRAHQLLRASLLAAAYSALHPVSVLARALGARSYSSAPASPPMPSSPPRFPPGRFGSLHFVDRDSEVRQIASANLENQSGVSNVRGTLVVATQMYGAGKTELGIHAVAHAASQRDELIRSFPEADVDAYLNAVTVFCELEPPAAGLSLTEYIAELLSDSITRTAEDNRGAEWAQKALNIKWRKVARTPVAVVEAFQKSTGRSILIHVDEVGSLETDSWSKLFAPAPANESDLQRRLRRYHAFWAHLAPLLQVKGAYLYVSGKSAGLPLISLGLLRDTTGSPVPSPTPLRHVFIGPLSTKEIDEAMRRTTTGKGIPLTERVAVAKHWHERFLQRLEEETAGHPRLVHYFLEGMSVQGVHIDSEEAVEAALRIGEVHADRMLKLKRNYTPKCPPDLFWSLLLVAAFDLPLNTATQVSLYGGTVRLLELIHNFNVYVVPATRVPVARKPTDLGEWVNVRVARCLLRRKTYTVRDVPLAGAILSLLLQTLRTPGAVLDRGEVLEWLVRLRLGLLLAHASFHDEPRTWAAAVPALASSAVGSEVVVRNEAAGGGRGADPPDSPLVFAPQVITDQNKREAAGTGYGAQLHVSKLDTLLAKLPRHKVVYFSPKSSSPDVMMRLESRLLCFACKCDSDGISEQVVREEIAKAAPFHERAKVTLVIVATALGATLQRKVQESGGMAWRTTVGAEESLKPNDATLAAAVSDMEVLVIGEEGLVSLLGKIPLDGLRKLQEDRRDRNELGAAIIEIGQHLFEPFVPSWLERFLRDEAYIDADRVKRYLPLLRKNEVTEANLHLLTDAMLRELGIEAALDRASILHAAQKRAARPQ